MSQSDFERYIVQDIKNMLSEAMESLEFIEQFALSDDSLRNKLDSIDMRLRLSRERISAVLTASSEPD
jgi:hypothetical protein